MIVEGRLYIAAQQIKIARQQALIRELEIKDGDFPRYPSAQGNSSRDDEEFRRGFAAVEAGDRPGGRWHQRVPLKS